MLTIVLAESELELVPARITGHRQVTAAARKAGRSARRMLLDASLHHAAMRALDDGARRGRPDLVHVTLLTLLESRANKGGHLRLAIHTRNDDWIDIDPATRLVRNGVRFAGLMEALFERGVVPSEETPLLRLRRGRTLQDGLNALAPDRLLWLEEGAPDPGPDGPFTPKDLEANVVAVLGGFPHGGFRTPRPPSAEAIGFGSEALAAWTAASELAVRLALQADQYGTKA